MRIVSWNCHCGVEGAKYEAIVSAYPDADIFVIQESKFEDTISDFIFYEGPEGYCPYGAFVEDGDHGITVFSKTWEVEVADEFNEKFKCVIPFYVSKNNKSFNLFAVWTKSDEYILYGYNKNIVLATKAPEYQPLFNAGSILIGDFNTFTKSDDNLQVLEKKIFPLVNCAKNTRFWKTATYYHGETNLSINDFCFFSESLIKRTQNRNFFVHDEWTIDKENNTKRWKGLSNHCPIIVDFDL